MNLLRSLALIALFIGPAKAAVVAPTLYSDTSKITRDPAYSNPANQTTASIHSEIDAEGFTVVTQSATALIQSSSTVNLEGSGGTRSMTSNHRFSSVQRQRLLSSPGGFRFDATTDISVGIASNLAISTYGRFFFTVIDDDTTTFETARQFRFVVDQPTHLLIHLSGVTTTTDFKGMFNNLVLRGGQFRPFVDSILQLYGTNYSASEETLLNAFGSKLGIDYELSGTLNSGGIDVLLKLSPTFQGTAPEAQLSWLVRSEINPTIGPSFKSWNRQTEASASIRESLIFRPVPEPSIPLLLAIPTLALLTRRQRIRTY